MGNRFRNRGAGNLGLQVRQAGRQPGRLRGRPSAPGPLSGDCDADSTLRSLWLCVSAAAVLALPILGTVWPAVAVAVGWLLDRASRRR
jgi:hypothetical protein